MKRIYQLLLVAAAVIGITTSCSDVPAPYEVDPGSMGGGKALPYKSTSLSTGWITRCLTTYEPWSQGSTYTQATGYQDWDQDGTKSNVEVESYLISPAFNTTCESGKVRFYFDNTIRYTNNVTGWINNEKIFVSKDFDGKDFTEASWEQIEWTPKASPYGDWTLYTSGQIQLPEAYVNQDSVYIAFYFYAPATASTTWELENFKIEEGEATESEDPIEVNEGEGSGTLEDPYNVAKANAIIAANAFSTDKVYVQGIISQIDQVDTSYGNAVYYISDDGTTANQLEVYRGYGLGGAKFTSESDIKVGDKVIVLGALSLYNTTPEIATGSQIVSLNGQTAGGGGELADPTGDGTQANPFNISAVIAYTSALDADTNSEPIYFTGIVSRTTDISPQYGNATFYVSDDGSASNEFYVFRCLGLNNAKITSTDEVKVGDKVVIYGPVVNYRGNTPETVANQAYIYSNTNTGGGGSQGGEQTGEGSLSNPFSVAALDAFCSAGNYSNSNPSNEVYVKGIVSQVGELNEKYGELNYYISDDGSTTGQFYVYNGYGLGGEKITSADYLKVGDEVLVCGKCVTYNGTNEFNYGSKIITLNGKSSGGGSDSGGTDSGSTDSGSTEGVSTSGTTVTLTNSAVSASSNTATIDLNDQGWENAEEVTSATFSDGSKVTFSMGSGGTTPKFYSATKGVRLYANNTLTITGASKAIAKAVLECDSYNGTDYVGNDTKTLSVDGNSLTLKNTYSTNSGGVQLRVKTITITYAE